MPARDERTPQDVTLGEVYRLVGDVNEKVDDLVDLPQRVENLETWRDRALIGLATIAMAGGAFFGVGL